MLKPAWPTSDTTGKNDKPIMCASMVKIGKAGAKWQSRQGAEEVVRTLPPTGKKIDTNDQNGKTGRGAKLGGNVKTDRAEIRYDLQNGKIHKGGKMVNW